MISAINSSISALNAMGCKMAVHSNNIANVNSDEFKKSRALMKEDVAGSVQVEVSKVDTPGPTYVETTDDGQITERELSNVDLAEEIPQTMLTERYYQANLKIFSVVDEMLGSVIDIIK